MAPWLLCCLLGACLIVVSGAWRSTKACWSKLEQPVKRDMQVCYWHRVGCVVQCGLWCFSRQLVSCCSTVEACSLHQADMMALHSMQPALLTRRAGVAVPCRPVPCCTMLCGKATIGLCSSRPSTCCYLQLTSQPCRWAPFALRCASCFCSTTHHCATDKC